MPMKMFALCLLFACACAAWTPPHSHATGGVQTRPKSRPSVARYACPMHPEVTAARPRKCPKCGMALRLSEDKTGAGASSPGDAEGAAAKDAAAKDAAAVKDDVERDELTGSPARIPDVRVLDQHGRRLNFYTDLVKGKTVAVNFIFTTCTTICPPLTATFRRVQQDAAARALDVRLISVSVDPATDTPERLLAFSDKFKAGPGWTFVTGDKNEIDALLRALGAAAGDKNDHTPMVLVVNDAAGYRTRAYGLSPPATLLKVIEEAAGRK